jgi:putative DNA primase/helicase
LRHHETFEQVNGSGDIWQRVRELVRDKVKRYDYETWFAGTALAKDQGSTIIVAVPSREVATWHRRNHQSDISEALHALGRTKGTVRYVVAGRRLPTNDDRDGWIITRVANVAPQPVEWRWQGRLAARKLTLLVGDPGLGKSWVSLDIAARESKGKPWPDSRPRRESGDVLLLSAEDGVADTIRPRLDALGADTRRIHVISARDQGRGVQLADVARLRQAITHTNARVVVVDPVSAYLGSIDSHRDTEVRSILAPLVAMAEQTGVAVLGVMHLSKGAQRSTIYRVCGSIGFSAAARLVLAVAEDPARQGRCILWPLKNNLGPKVSPLAYTVQDGGLQWETTPVSDVNVEQLLMGPPEGSAGDEPDAEELLTDLLGDEELKWPIDAAKALAAGAQNGIHPRTMRRTAKKLDLTIQRVGFGRGGEWLWHRPGCPGNHGTKACKGTTRTRPHHRGHTT